MLRLFFYLGACRTADVVSTDWTLHRLDDEVGSLRNHATQVDVCTRVHLSHTHATRGTPAT